MSYNLLASAPSNSNNDSHVFLLILIKEPLRPLALAPQSLKAILTVYSSLISLITSQENRLEFF